MDRIETSADGRVIRLAREAGVVPNDPLGPLVEIIAEMPTELASALGPAIAAINRAAETAKAAATRGPLTDRQVEDYIAPRLVGGWLASIIIIGAALVAVAGIGGYFYGRASTPTRVWAGVEGDGIQCDDPNQYGEVLCHIPVWKNHRALPPPEVAPAPPTPAPVPATHATKGGPPTR